MPRLGAPEPGGSWLSEDYEVSHGCVGGREACHFSRAHYGGLNQAAMTVTCV